MKLVNPWILVAALVGLIATSYFSYSEGVSAEQGREAIARQAAQAKYDDAVKAAYEELGATVRRHTKEIAAKDAEYQVKIKETKNALDAALARSRASGLFVNARCPSDSPSPLPSAPTSPSVDHGSERVQLSQDDGDFLIRFASSCDTVTDQLRAAQSVITADRVAP